MGYMKFRIRCRRCGHLNMPNNNTRKGIQQTLQGDFSECRGCGIKWSVINVPFRPLVKQIAFTIGNIITERVHLFEYEGQVPRASAF